MFVSKSTKTTRTRFETQTSAVRMLGQRNIFDWWEISAMPFLLHAPVRVYTGVHDESHGSRQPRPQVPEPATGNRVSHREVSQLQ